MSKRKGNCTHDRLEILPGNNILCQRCGEAIEVDDPLELGDWSDMDVEITPSVPKPLTHRIKGLP